MQPDPIRSRSHWTAPASRPRRPGLALGTVESSVLHALRGRVRLHLVGWSGGDACELEERIGRCSGVRAVKVSPLTHNVLIHFDPNETGVEALRRAVAILAAGGSISMEEQPTRQGETVAEPLQPRTHSARSLAGSTGSPFRTSKSEGSRRAGGRGRTAPPRVGTWKQVGRLIAILHELAATRQLLSRLFGRRTGGMLPYVPKLLGLGLSLATAGGPLGLLISGFEVVHLLSQIRAAWLV